MWRWLLLIIACGTAHAEGRIGFGVRGSSTSDSHGDDIYDDTFRIRGAIDGTAGLRFDRLVLGVRAGIATPLRFTSSPIADSGEQVATTSSTVFPLDLGLTAQFDVDPSVWISAWLGTTASLSHATSPAARIDAIDFTGNIPASSWSAWSLGLGFGAALGYAFDGRWSAMLAFESQAIGPILIRQNDGTTGIESDRLTNRSFTIGVSYSLR